MTTPTPGDNAAAPDDAAEFAAPGMAPAGAPVMAPPAAPAMATGWRTRGPWVSEGWAGLGVAIAVAALGLPLGWLWGTFAPHVQVVMTPDGPFHVEAEPEGYIGAEGWYVVIALGVGLLTAVVVWLVLRSRRGPAVLAGLALGSVVAGLLMAWLGHRIGLAHYERLLHTATVGTRFERPVDLRTKLVNRTHVQGAVLVQAIAAVAMYSLMAAFSNYPSLRRVSSDWSVLPARPMAPAPPVTAAGAPPPG